LVLVTAAIRPPRATEPEFADEYTSDTDRGGLVLAEA